MDEPARYLFEETLRDGTPVVLRAIRPDDRERIRSAFRKLERETIYTRFFAAKSELSDRELTRYTVVDFDRDVVLVVTTRSNGEEIVIGSACYFSAADDGSERTAEIAFTVEEDYQRRGIASLLMKHLVQIAREHRLCAFGSFRAGPQPGDAGGIQEKPAAKELSTRGRGRSNHVFPAGRTGRDRTVIFENGA